MVSQSGWDRPRQSWWTWTIWRTRWPLRWKIAIQTLLALNVVVWLGDMYGWWAALGRLR